MKNKSGVSVWVLARVLGAVAAVALAGCKTGGDDGYYVSDAATPTVDYVESLDVYSAPHKDSFLNQLAMNYRSYAIYNARTSGYPEMGELFAQKAVAAFSGETPFPETLSSWNVADEQTSFEIYTAYNELMEQLKNDASYNNPELAAEAQAKFDCWISAVASGQDSTAHECRDRYYKTMTALRDCTGGKIVSGARRGVTKTETTTTETVIAVKPQAAQPVQAYYPDTRNMGAMRGTTNAREGVIIVNNVNVPEHLINPVPVQPMIFNQNIYGGDKSVINSGECTQSGKSGGCDAVVVVAQPNTPQQAQSAPQPMQSAPQQAAAPQPVEMPVMESQQIPMVGDELVTREEFINMMMAMRAELQAINNRLDQLQTKVAASAEKTMIKVQQIPLEPKQHVMEEVFEIRFDFNKATIKPEYEELIRKLATATQNNKNIKVSVVGHTDTMGSSNYNYALGGRRADAVQKMLIQYGIPASQIVAVSAGEQDLAVPTPDNTPNAANRRVRVVKEVHYSEEAPSAPVEIEVQEYSATQY